MNDERVQLRTALSSANQFLAQLFGEPRSLSSILRDGGLETAAIETIRRAHLATFLDELHTRWMTALRLAFDPRSVDVLVQRLGLDGQPPPALEELAAAHGISRERVRQIEERGLRRLRSRRRRALLASAVVDAAKAVLEPTIDAATTGPARSVPTETEARELCRRLVLAARKSVPTGAGSEVIAALLVGDPARNFSAYRSHPLYGCLVGYDPWALIPFIQEVASQQPAVEPEARLRGGSGWPPGVSPRFFAPWTPEDDRVLLEGHAAGLGTQALATKLCRPPGAVQDRLRTLRPPNLTTPTIVPPLPEHIARARIERPRAYLPWTEAEEHEVWTRTQRGESVETIAAHLQRQPGAIASCLRRLGLTAPQVASAYARPSVPTAPDTDGQ
jgi:hypothetical protein